MILSGQFYDCVITTSIGIIMDRKIFAESENEAFDKAYDRFCVNHKIETIEVRENV